MSSLPSERGFSSSSLFVWLFALALSTRIAYTEVVQLSFFLMLFTCGWMSPSLRSGVLICLKRFFARSEGKIALLLLSSMVLTTLLVSARSDKASSVFLWKDLLLFILFSGGLFGCTALLGQKLDALRRAFRLVGAMFGFSVVLLLLTALYKNDLLRFFSWLLPVKVHLDLYWDGIYNGIAVVFVPLVLAACAKAGIGRSANARHRLFWRYWVLTTLTLFLYGAFVSERRVVGVILVVCLIVLSVAVILHYANKMWGILLGLAAVVVGLALFAYLYHYPKLYPIRLSDCLPCNETYLPLWLVDAPRQVAWHEMIVLWQKYPWFGIGIHNETTVLTYPHSRFLQILGNLGAVGFCLFLVLLCVSAFKSLCAWKANGSLRELSLLLVHSVYWTGGLFDLSIWSVWHVCIYICAIVMSLSLDRLTGDKLTGG